MALVGLVAALLFAPLPALANEGFTCIEVIDGDSISVTDGEAAKRIDLWGIDAPELQQTWGPEAASFLADLILDQTITLDTVDESGGSLIARVAADGADVGARVVERGLAWLPEDGDTSEEYAVLALTARISARGIWSDPDRLHPARWRSQQAAKMTAPPTPTPIPRTLSEIANEIDIAGAGSGATISNESFRGKRIILPDTEYGRCANQLIRQLVSDVAVVRSSISDLTMPTRPEHSEALTSACKRIQKTYSDFRSCPDEGRYELWRGDQELGQAMSLFSSSCNFIENHVDPATGWKELVKGEAKLDEARMAYENQIASKQGNRRYR